MPNDVICSLRSIYENAECSFSLLCLEPTELIRIPFAVLQEYSRTDIEISNYLIGLLLKLSMKKEKREYELLCLSAEERFVDLVKSKPELLHKVTQNDIAHYLGITPVGLSRIKKRRIKGTGYLISPKSFFSMTTTDKLKPPRDPNT